jgi:ligand-binding sensor domain-containing protein
MNHLLSAHGKTSGVGPGCRLRQYFGQIVAACGLLLALAPVARAVQPYVPKSADPLLDPWRWKKIPELEGKSPRCMVGGKDGAMWFGLPTEIVRYDGEKWQSFPLETGAAPNALCCSNTGVIYVGTTRGIDRFADGRWEHVFPRDRAQAPRIGNLLAASDGSLWGATADFVLQIKGSVFTLFANAARSGALRQAFPEASVVVIPDAIFLPGTAASTGPTVVTAALYETPDGMIWWGLVHGDIYRHDPHIAKRDDPAAWRLMSGTGEYRKETEGYDQRVILQTNDGLVWVGCGRHDIGVNRYDPAKDTWSYLSLSEMFGGDNIVHSIIETRDGSVLLGGFARILRCKAGQWTVYATPEVPLSSTRISLYESQAGDLYVLGLGDDVQKMDYKESRWLKYEGLNFQCETPDGRQWFVSVDDGVVSFDGKRWQRYGLEDGLMSAPYTLLCTRTGQLWAAGVHEGKAATAWLAPDGWHRRTFETIQPQFGFIIDYRAVTESADGSLWFGSYINGIVWAATNGGILQYDPRRGPPEDDRAWTNHYDADYRVSSGIAQTTDGSIYAAKYGAITRYDGRKWAPVPLLPPSPNNALASSLDGRLWIGQRGDGLLCYDGTTVTKYTIKDGLKSNVISSLFCDRDNHLWVGSSNGISYYDGKEWTTDVFLDAKVTINLEGGGFKQSADGALWINQCSRSWMRRVLPENQNRAAIARSFSTIRYLRERIAPRVEIISSVTQVSQPGNTVIAWRGQSPWWRTQESDLRYSQRLDDGPWSGFSAETSHVFLQLPPGPHRVEVRVRDRDSNVSPDPARVQFVVLPPIWQEPWFIALMTVLTGAVVTQTTRVFLLRTPPAPVQSGARRGNRRAQENRERNWRRKPSGLEHEIEERKRMERRSKPPTNNCCSPPARPAWPKSPPASSTTSAMCSTA